jgi:cell division protein FtsL
MRECAGYHGVILAKNKKDFIIKIKSCLRHSHSPTTIAILKRQAQQNTWHQRAKQISSRLEKHEHHFGLLTAINRCLQSLLCQIPQFRQLINNRDTIVRERDNLKIEIFKMKLQAFNSPTPTRPFTTHSKITYFIPIIGHIIQQCDHIIQERDLLTIELQKLTKHLHQKHDRPRKIS